eukprot:scaffold867_cov317-Pavlova_lutheri.AAC.29
MRDTRRSAGREETNRRRVPDLQRRRAAHEQRRQDGAVSLRLRLLLLSPPKSHCFHIRGAKGRYCGFLAAIRLNLMSPIRNPWAINGITNAPRRVSQPEFKRPTIPRGWRAVRMTAPQKGATNSDQSSTWMLSRPCSFMRSS